MENLNETSRGGTFCLSKAGLGKGTTGKQIAIASPNGAGVDYAIGGILYHKADAASAAIPAAGEQAADTTCLYLVCLDSAGALGTAKGKDVKNTDIANNAGAIHYPAVPAGGCAIGAIKIKTVAVTFTAGTTAFDAAGVTATFSDLFAVPAAPLAA